MRIILTVLVLFSLFAFAGCMDNGTSADYSAQQSVVQSGYTYLTTLNWPEYAKLMHPQALMEFRMALIPGIEKLVANTQGDSIMIFNKAFNSVEIQSMPEDTFFVSMMKLMESLTPEFAATYKNIQATVLGSVPEADSMVHVVSRTTMSFGMRSVSEMEVQTVRMSDGQWLLEPSNKITGIVMILRQGLPQ